MKGPHVYDKAKYHYDGDYPDELPIEQAFVHTGMFLGWLIDRGLYSDEYWQDMQGYIASFKSREMTGARVYEVCDGALVDDMLSDEGNAFARAYFDFDEGAYINDYEQLLAEDLPTTYHVEDSWDNYEKLKEVIDRRYEEWKKEHA